MRNMSSRRSRKIWIKKKRSEADELACTKEKLSARVEEMEHKIVDLQDQLQ
jgi:hypothetical protein